MYADLTRIGKWQERLTALGVPEEVFWSSVAPDDFGVVDSLSLSERLKEFEAFVVAHAGPPNEQAGYVAGLPSLPGGVERFLLLKFEAAVGADEAGVMTSATLRDSLLFPLLRRIHFFMAPCLVTSLDELSKSGELEGATPQDRFEFFVRSVQVTPAWTRSFFDRYPLLARRVLHYIETRCCAIGELLARWSRDRRLLVTRFRLDPSDTQALIRAGGPLGDPHNGGRAVFSIELPSGRRIVYKPRSLALDVAFQGFLQWLNARGLRHGHAALECVDRGTYGWVEFIEPEACRSREEVSRFYWRQGSYLAILYLLGGRDFFYENVRARGEFPFLVDVECLLSPIQPDAAGPIGSTAGRRYMTESVLSVGLLPTWAWGNEKDSGVNLSALSVIDGQLTPMELPAWENVGRDDLRLVTRRQTLRSSHAHLPHLSEQPVPLNEYMRELALGFEDTYRTIQAHRAELLDPSGPLSQLAMVPVRVVLRQTNDYTRLMQELCHPDYLGHAYDFDRFLERLFSSLSPRFTARLIQCEIDDLWNLDVPYFYTLATSRGIWSARGQGIEAAFFAETSIEGIRRRLARFSHEDCKRQLDIATRSLMLVEVPEHDTTSPMVRVAHTAPCGLPNELGVHRSDLIDEAAALAERLLAAGIEDDVSLTWLDLAMDYSGRWSQGSLDVGLYDGAEGIAFFLLYAGSITRRSEFHDRAMKVVRYSALGGLHLLRSERPRIKDWIRLFPSAMSFPASSLYLVMHAERCGGQELLTEESLDAALDWIQQAVELAPRYDFLVGAAGLLHVLLMVDQRYSNTRSLSIARRCGEILIDDAKPQRRGGIAWATTLHDEFLCGFSHGTSGIAPALFALSHRTHDETYSNAALGALEYERTLYRNEWQDWQDVRIRDADEPAQYAGWCHGAAGIALGRALCLPHVADHAKDVAAEMDAAIARVLRNDWQKSDCLCHGNAGNIDVFLICSQRSGRTDLKELAYRKLSEVWTQSRTKGVWRTGLPERNVALPGMFMGLAGIGHMLLRFADPTMCRQFLRLSRRRH